MDATSLALTMIIHYQAVLKTPLSAEARAVVLLLLAQAEADFARARGPLGRPPRRWQPRIARLPVP